MDRSAVMRFGPFAFDRARMVLERDGQPVPIGGRGAALLAALVDAQGQVVTRDELLEAAWPNLVVEERNLTVQIAALRKAMGELPTGEGPIRTVSRVGYRLLLDGLAPPGSTILALRPTVAVLPFANMTCDPELAFFADGVTEDIIAALSRFQTFAVAARGSSFTYKGKPVQVAEVARTLGVRYVLEGSVRREGHRLRVSARVSDANGLVQWADSFEEELGGLFEIQDHITATVVGLVEPQITRAELERSRRKHPENLDAYDHFLQGMALFNRLEASTALYDRFVGHFDRAVELDPSFPQGLAIAGWAHEYRRSFGGVTPPGQDDFALATDLCGRALEQSDSDGVVLVVAGLEAHNVRNDGVAALALAERAVALNPLSPLVLNLAGVITSIHGNRDEGLDLYQRCLQLSPHSPDVRGMYRSIGITHLSAGRPAEAVEWFKRAIALQDDRDLTHLMLTVAHVQLGQMDEAHAALEQLLRVRPGATIRSLIERQPPGTRTRVERLWPGALRRAGLPEG